jgi:hypothetical protein
MYWTARFLKSLLSNSNYFLSSFTKWITPISGALELNDYPRYYTKSWVIPSLFKINFKKADYNDTQPAMELLPLNEKLYQ